MEIEQNIQIIKSKYSDANFMYIYIYIIYQKYRLLYQQFKKIREIGNYEENKLIIKKLLELLVNFLIEAGKENQNIFE